MVLVAESLSKVRSCRTFGPGPTGHGSQGDGLDSRNHGSDRDGRDPGISWRGAQAGARGSPRSRDKILLPEDVLDQYQELDQVAEEYGTSQMLSALLACSDAPKGAEQRSPVRRSGLITLETPFRGVSHHGVLVTVNCGLGVIASGWKLDPSGSCRRRSMAPASCRKHSGVPHASTSFAACGGSRANAQGQATGLPPHESGSSQKVEDMNSHVEKITHLVASPEGVAQHADWSDVVHDIGVGLPNARRSVGDIAGGRRAEAGTAGIAHSRVIPWATTDNGEYLYWLVLPGSHPDEWTAMVNEARGDWWEHFDVGCVQMLARLLTGDIRLEILSSSFPTPVHEFRVSGGF